LNLKPPAGNCRGFFFLLKSKMPVAKSEKPISGRLRLVYYLWSAEGPFRISDRLHRALVQRSVALPQFAATKQKILEAVIRTLTREAHTLSARGLMYSFDADGLLDVGSKTEGLIPLPRFRASETNVIDVEPKIRARRIREENTWKPTKPMLDLIWSDVDPQRPRGPRLPLLRPSKSP
jgi:hypothetical protein